MDGVRAAAGVVRTLEGEDQTILFIVLMDLIYLFVSQTAAIVLLLYHPFICWGTKSHSLELLETAFRKCEVLLNTDQQRCYMLLLA